MAVTRKTPLLFLEGQRLEFTDDGGIWIRADRSNQQSESQSDFAARSARLGDPALTLLPDDSLGRRLASSSSAELLVARTADDAAVEVLRFPDDSMLTLEGLAKAARLNDLLERRYVALVASLPQLELGPGEALEALLPIASGYFRPPARMTSRAWTRLLRRVEWGSVPEPYRAAHLLLRAEGGSVRFVGLELFLRYLPGLPSAPPKAPVQPSERFIEFNGRRFSLTPGISLDALRATGPRPDGRVRFVIELEHQPGQAIRAEHEAAGLRYLAPLGRTEAYFVSMPELALELLPSLKLLRAAAPWTASWRAFADGQGARLDGLAGVPHARVRLTIGYHADVSDDEFEELLRAVGAEEVSLIGGPPYPTALATVELPAYQRLLLEERLYSVAISEHWPSAFVGEDPPGRTAREHPVSAEARLGTDGATLLLGFDNPSDQSVTVPLPQRSFHPLSFADQGAFILRGVYTCAAQYVHVCYHADPLVIPPRGRAERHYPWRGGHPRGLSATSPTIATAWLSDPPPPGSAV